ncbi:MAG TPA: hypothetical protein VIY48_11920 [Candidatus Paceibacterota bacterium]
MTTPNHNLDLIPDGDQPWGQRMRNNLSTIDVALGKVRATMWALDNTQATDIITQNVPVKANIPNTAGISPCGCIAFAPNRATYTGTDRSITVVASFTLDAVGNNKDYRVYLGHNGGIHQYSSAKVRDATAGSFGSGTLTGVVDIVSGDYLEMWVANLTDSADVVFVDLSMTIHG